MLGKCVRVEVTMPIGSVDAGKGIIYRLNCGSASLKSDSRGRTFKACIVGVDHEVRTFDGRVVAIVKHKDSRENYYVVAPMNSSYIDISIENSIAFLERNRSHRLECLYEFSCGAIVFRYEKSSRLFLLIRNKGSRHWGFPKGHIEKGETETETALREVLEETGLRVRLLPDFREVSSYVFQGGRRRKKVIFFLGEAPDAPVRPQQSEISDYCWADFDKAFELLNFDNDKRILRAAQSHFDGA